MRRFYDIVIRPNHDECPLRYGIESNCNECIHCQYIGTLGGEYYVDCDAEYENGDVVII